MADDVPQAGRPLVRGRFSVAAAKAAVQARATRPGGVKAATRFGQRAKSAPLRRDGKPNK